VAVCCVACSTPTGTPTFPPPIDIPGRKHVHDVYIDTVVERGIQQRIQLGRMILGTAFAIFLGGVVARLTQLSKETLLIA
jgi:hypothetical protein